MATQGPGDLFSSLISHLFLLGTWQLGNFLLGNIRALLVSGFAQNDLPAWNALFHFLHWITFSLSLKIQLRHHLLKNTFQIYLKPGWTEFPSLEHPHLHLSQVHYTVWQKCITCPSLSTQWEVSGPQTFWHQGLVSWKTIFPWTGWDTGDGSAGNVSDGEPWGAADEASLASPPLTSCCVARFLTGHRLVLVHGPGVGDPWSREFEERGNGLEETVKGEISQTKKKKNSQTGGRGQRFAVSVSRLLLTITPWQCSKEVA